ncbi:N(2)-acetyl-L-2,4-diaminobutanoate deacetylase DoeB [Enterovibrio nigricans]|uniref:N-alpha-acetyl-L-2,4-diaminobutyrate deacetylase n=1 Tax=Enterovibrio nigricans DSM 22720 TaxID=1121868 RepID=A0A1T4VBY3_9GAMM|nr:N(2)-acetyl-L-2,4-diaminobutanoate deacetylase DoeB [Enterovibrio nigricans]SKA62021.1 N-alpha-acetyl-L-2,4-diaminobutyrate deacetylase [Enterovibrio nigricans DSM 22720]
MSRKMPPSAISTNIDFNADGVQHGFLKLPYSSDQSAWGAVMIPITIVKNGTGQTALLTGGNHGDEYEGIISLQKLSNTLKQKHITGRVIIIPMMNHPAVAAGSRVSPIDGGNMNRAFPGHPQGSITGKIADYFNRVLIPMCDAALDIHSGGKTLDILPFAAAHRLPDKLQELRCWEGARLFGAPYYFFMEEMDAVSLYDTAVEKQGKVFVTTELGGGGTTTPETVALADRGIHNFLVYSGILQRNYIDPPADPKPMEIPSAKCYLQSEHRGVMEITVKLGQVVVKGDLIASIHSVERTGQSPKKYYATTEGIICAVRHQSLINIGDTFAVIAKPLLTG